MKGYAANLIARAIGGAADITPRPVTRYEAVAEPGDSRPAAPVLEWPTSEVAANPSEPSSPAAQSGHPPDRAAETPRGRSVPSRDSGDGEREFLMPTNREKEKPFEPAARSPAENATSEDSRFSFGREVPVPAEAVRETPVSDRPAQAPDALSDNESPLSPAFASGPPRRESSRTAIVPPHTTPRPGPGPARSGDGDSVPGSRTVNVHIGRVEVRAQFAAPVAPPRRPVSNADRTLSLEDYLKTGTGGRS